MNLDDRGRSQQSMTRVSIVTISFNQAEFLERTIKSVLTQDYPEIEYIVVDPGSTDGSREIIDRYRSEISKLVLDPDRGAADGLNHGFAEATGEIFGFLNSDDLLLPGAVSAAVSFLDEHSNIGVVSGHSKLISFDDHILRGLYSDRMSVNRCVYGAAFLIQPSTFFRREMFERVGGFRAESKACWDGELFLEMALAGAKFAIVDEFWSAYRIHPNSVTGAKSSEARVVQTQANIFSRIKGRQPRRSDKLLTYLYRLLRHILNPLDTWERIRRGPAFARTLDN
jgi:glycosyltransferase involved in cell wall biosynthesis